MLETRNLTVRIGTNTLLENVTLKLKAKEFLAVLGPNGAGKSTFLKTICGEIKPNSGEVMLEGIPLKNWKPLELAKRRAVLPQDSYLEFNFTALEVALLGRNPFIVYRETPRDIQIAKAALRMVDAAHLETRAYPTLSGGERQRVQLARVLAQIWGEPVRQEQTNQAPSKFLLLDEPTASLDLAHQHETLAIARGLTLEGIGVMAVLHDLNLASAYADKIAVLQHSRLVAYGTPSEVLTTSLIQEVFGVQAVVQNLDGIPTIYPIAHEAKSRNAFLQEIV